MFLLFLLLLLFLVLHVHFYISVKRVITFVALCNNPTNCPIVPQRTDCFPAAVTSSMAQDP